MKAVGQDLILGTTGGLRRQGCGVLVDLSGLLDVQVAQVAAGLRVDPPGEMSGGVPLVCCATPTGGASRCRVKFRTPVGR